MADHILLMLSMVSLLAVSCKKEPSPVGPPASSEPLTPIIRVLTNGQQPAVSPDGSKIAFTYNGNIFVMDTSVQVTGTWIGAAWHYDTTGGNIKQLTFSGQDFLPRWKSDGQTIGFVRSNLAETNMGLIFSVPAAGGAATQLIFNQFAEDYSYAVRWDWSPDGKYIAFFSYDNLASKESLNVTLSSNGIRIYTAQTYSLHAPSEGSSSFAWSLTPDEIAYSRQSRDSDGTGELWLVNLMNGKAIKDTSGVRLVSSLCRSPLENKFAYNALPLYTPTIEVTDFKNRLNEYSVSSAGGLKWSQDEKYFIYQSVYSYSGPGPYTVTQISLYNIAKNKEYLLISASSFNQINLNFEWGYAPNTVYFEFGAQIAVVNFKEP